MARRRGVTLLELLAVVVIVGIVAAIGAPQFFQWIDRSRAGEAFHVLGAIRNGQLAYRSTKGDDTTYTTLSAEIDVTLPTGTWTYVIATAPATVAGGADATATRANDATKVIKIDLNTGTLCTTVSDYTYFKAKPITPVAADCI